MPTPPSPEGSVAVALDPSGNYAFLHVDADGNLLVSGGGGGGVTSVNGKTGAVVLDFPDATILYVAKNGDDSAGDGTQGLPFATITKALTVIGSSASASSPFLISVGPGIFDEASTNLNFPAYVFLEGAGPEATEIRYAQWGITQPASLSVAFWGFYGFTFNPSAGPNFFFDGNYVDVGSRVAFYDLRLVQNGQPLEVSTSQYYLDIRFDSVKGRINSNIQCSGGTQTYFDCNVWSLTIQSYYNGSISIPATADIFSSVFNDDSTSIVLDQLGSTSVACYLIGSRCLGNITLVNNSNLYYDALIRASQVVPSGGSPSSYLLSGADSTLYTAGDPTKWASPAPTTVQAALNRIAAVVGAVTPIP